MKSAEIYCIVLADSPDIAPNDYPLFWLLKVEPSGRYFSSDEEVKTVVHE
jgi:hypothetical protein